MDQAGNISTHFLKGSLQEWRHAARCVGYGGILACEKGHGTLLHNFRRWEISQGAVMSFFPNDVIQLESASDDFDARVLVYSAETLRAASLQLESVVYEWLRNDCCTTDPWVFRLTESTFSLLGFYLEDRTFGTSGSIVLLHLKAYFLGLHDRVVKSRSLSAVPTRRENRIRQQFNMFMELVEKDYRSFHSVRHYADELSVSPKHLTTITKRITGKPAKELIDEYITMQLRLSLSDTDASIKEIAWDYNFPSTAFFCSYFEKRTGLTPHQYRRARQV